ncbi:hypothetical protein BU24DRAFT_487536 [Aaosphaeria arxii CBS 175.79]|uniref:Zn(2)-C6 fungal-type domain-containing protein n=1 Tax=Aaosphaeria arxii CBS 175.79 TaxID=1450172 RepID=A0A6A5Y6Y0_9PLEO|nr:uncharacterized protein BU24DRAFT_487536 [Aaosphaeria arxii CBS 175.79]KAF2021036.1 hypothetical protein BU24DRAFT_487536 [Aaosphaeria arxii CBS 175.79]
MPRNNALRSPPGGRPSTACHRCHDRKVKCSREVPCRNCHLAHRTCTYPSREQFLTVPESYIRNLEANASRLSAAPATYYPAVSSRPNDVGTHANGATSSGSHSKAELLVEDPTTEGFVSRLKRFRQPYLAGSSSQLPHDSQSSPSNVGGNTPQESAYEYVRLNFDTKNPSLSIKLPPYPYALVLLNQFDVFLGHDWHWFLRKTFREKLNVTYQQPFSDEASDRTWLCRLLVVFALGESYNSGQPPEIHFLPDGSHASHSFPDRESKPPPGTQFFEQALALLNIRHENPSIDQVEALNLIAFYSYSLNRRKAAYSYAGQSTRMSNMLGLHKPPTSTTSSIVELEHQKRVWWTTYCLDRMTSTEMGLPTAIHISEVEISYPEDSPLLTPEQREEFGDAHTINAYIQLAFIHADICENMKSLDEDTTANVGKWTGSIVQRLNDLKAGLPPHLNYDFEDGIPEPVKQLHDRSLASLYQRYNQCFILLLRPLFLKRIMLLLSSKTTEAEQEDLQDLTNICLRMARTTLNIIIDLWNMDKIAKFGFWESLHLFSSLTILSLANSVNSRWPGSFNEKPNDAATYETAKNLLLNMVLAGNLASKGQACMLEDVEAFHEVCWRDDRETFEIDSSWNLDDWISQITCLAL